jgi:RsiW-degrading membrane proteinase PrsW (M82 family)
MTEDRQGEESAIRPPREAERWVKTLVMLWGMALLMPVPPLLLSFCCTLLQGWNGDTWSQITAVLITVGLGCGGTMFLGGARALSLKPSKPLRLPPLWALVGGFVLSLAIGLGLWQLRGIGTALYPWFLILAAATPPIAAVAWAMNDHPGRLTRRRAGVAFTAGATVAVPLAVLLEFLVPYTLIWLLLDLGEPVLQMLEQLVQMLAGGNVAHVITSPGFLLVLLELAIVAPLAEEFARPLVVLPLLKGLGSQREAFLLGALAGAGFAGLENIAYALFAVRYWGGVLTLRALSAAVHPLGAGLTALGWYALVNRRAGAARQWLSNYGLAVGQHALWNGGQALWMALAGAMFFGPQPQETDVLGISIAAGMLALLALEGVILLVSLRMLTRRFEPERATESLTGKVDPDRAIALWAVVCLAALLPAGLVLLRGLWSR